MSRIALRPPPSRYRLRRYARRTDICHARGWTASRLASTLKTDTSLRRIAAILLAATIFSWLQAQVPVRDAAEVQKQLDRLQTLGSALYIAAHPDDENTAVLATL